MRLRRDRAVADVTMRLLTTPCGPWTQQSELHGVLQPHVVRVADIVAPAAGVVVLAEGARLLDVAGCAGPRGRLKAEAAHPPLHYFT